MRKWFQNRIGLVSQKSRSELASEQYAQDRIRILESLVDTSEIPYYCTDENGRFLECNPATCNLLGYSRLELLDMSVADIDVGIIEAAHQTLLDPGADVASLTVNSEPIDKHGNRVAMEFAVSRVQVKGRTYLCTFGRKLSTAEQDLRQSERQLRMITDSLPVMIAYVDTEFLFQFNNAMYEKRFGKRPSELKGTHLSGLVGDAVFTQIRPYFETAFEGTSVSYEQRIRFRDGQSQISSVRLVPDRSLAGEVQGVYALVDDITQRRSLEKEVLNISAEKQRRMGQDLHDGAGQELTGLGMIADALLLALTRKNAEERPIAEKMARGVKRAIHSVRALARGLNPVDISAAGLASALTQMAEHVEDLYGITCCFEQNTDFEISDHQTATQLFRIAQEATTNAAKHSQAKNVTITLSEEGQQLVLVVVDDGIGIADSEQLRPGMGIRSMRYRAALVGGRIQIASRPSGGTEVRFQGDLSILDSPDLGSGVHTHPIF